VSKRLVPCASYILRTRRTRLDSDGRLTRGEPPGPGEFAARAGVALVLGASGGLGAAIAAMLLARGSRVFISGQKLNVDGGYGA
jgi:hypothetical protein